MALYDNAYSRLVAFLKVVLPLVALAILSTLFLLARGRDPERSIPYSDAETVVRDQRVAGPAYSGMTRDGAAITVTAASAQPAEGGVKAELPSALIELPGGSHATIEAVRGRFDEAGNALELSGGVRVESSTGWVVESDAMKAGLQSGTVESDATVTATGPTGTLTAGQMRLSRAEGGNLALFGGGVRLVYNPVDRR
jgi:lipopolysaccharide export system protein LptC